MKFFNKVLLKDMSHYAYLENTPNSIHFRKGAILEVDLFSPFFIWTNFKILVPFVLSSMGVGVILEFGRCDDGSGGDVNNLIQRLRGSIFKR